MSITGPGDGPAYRLGVAVADLVTGMFAMQGILLALIARARTGRGQHVDVAMLDAAAALLTYQASIYFTHGRAAAADGQPAPLHRALRHVRGRRTASSCSPSATTRSSRPLCELAGLSELARDPRFSTNAGRVRHYEQLRPALAAVFRRRTRGEWIAALTRAGVPAGSVRDVGEVLRDPQLLHRAMIETSATRLPAPIQQLGPAGEAVRRRPAPSAGRRRLWASTRPTCWPAIWVWMTREIARLRAIGGGVTGPI